MSNFVEENIKPDYDQVMQDIADYVLKYEISNNEAYETARLCLMDTLGCGIKALSFDECTKLLGPVVPGASITGGVRVPGTHYELDPVQAAFNIGTMIRWLDFNDAWLAAEWGHPSDNLGAILAVSDFVSRRNESQGKRALSMMKVLTAMIKAHEIQGCMALENSFNRVGLDHVILVKLASAAVAAELLGADRDQVLRTLSQVFVDGQSLRTYRHAPNAGSRKSWAAGDATARAVRLALICERGEMGYPSALTAPKWGFYDVSFKGEEFKFQRPFSSYVMDHVLFKLPYPAEYHAQTAVECAQKLHEELINRYNDVNEIELQTQESAIRIISKKGELHNPADRDHCLQYMVAVTLLYGDLKPEYYEDETASDPRIDHLRALMTVKENSQFSKDYLDPDKRSIPNSVRLNYKDGSTSDWITVEYPLGHKRRRAEGVKVLQEKFVDNLKSHFSEVQVEEILNIHSNLGDLGDMSVTEYMKYWIPKK